jgi:hypothetical protein
VDRASLSAASSGRAEGRVAPVTLGPSLQYTCALLCGYLAAGLGPGDGVAILRLVAIWLLADATVGYVLAQLVAVRVCVWDSVTRSEQQATAYSSPLCSSLRMALPYAAEGSPGARLAVWLSSRVARCRDQVGARALTHGLAAVVTSGLVLVIATYLGRETLALAGFGLFSAAGVMVLSGKDVDLVRRWFAGLHVALAWQLGYVVLAPWNYLALGIAALAGLGTWARTRLTQGDSAIARWLSTAVQVVWIFLLLLRGQPVLAASLAILTLGERIAQPSLRSHLAWLLSMALVALGARYWD